MKKVTRFQRVPEQQAHLSAMWFIQIKILQFIFSDGTEITMPVEFTVKADDKAQPKVEAKGFYIVNEGWYAHDKGSVNYFEKNGTFYTPHYPHLRQPTRIPS